MLNLIRADLYRIVRGKALYITAAVLIGFTILLVLSQESFVIGVDNTTLNEARIEEMQQIDALQGETNTGSGIARVLYSTDWLQYFMLSVIIFVAAPIFSHGTIKNSLSSGVSRVKIYLSKLILILAGIAVMMVLYMGFGMLLATFRHGFGSPTAGYWGELFKVLGTQFVVLSGFAGIGALLVFATKRVAIVNSAYIAYHLVPALVISILRGRFPSAIKYYDYFLGGLSSKFEILPMLPSSEVAQIIAAALTYLVVTTVLGVALFKKVDVK
jgi:ABC-2 type transport system permease protein